MDPARWKRVEEVFLAASGREIGERATFLEGACAGDEDLRREVESLLAQPSADDLLHQPAWEAATAGRDMPSEAARLAIGQRLAHYEIQAKLGEGGMGVVYKAIDRKLGRVVALKFPRADEVAGEEERNRILREARAASALDHPNIGAIHGIEDAPDGRLFIVMAYYDGETLAARIRRAPMPLAQALDLAIPVANALAEAHAKGIVHRDVKPANVMITPHGIPKVVDFGLARKESASITQSLTLRGTVSYMSPEQVLGRRVDHRSDIWSFGVTLAEMTTGRRPFEGANAPATLYAVVHAPPADLDRAPPELCPVIYRALAKVPAERYQTMKEVVEDLRGLQTPGVGAVCSMTPGDLEACIRRSSAPSENRAAPRSTRRRWALWTALAAVLLAAAGLSLRQEFTGGAGAGYDSYLKGLAYLQRYDKPRNVDRAIAAFGAARRADPTSALALAGLADSYYTKYSLEHDSRWVDRALDYCRQASAINNRLAPVYVSLGRIHDGTGKHELALEEFQRALQLDPRNADAFLGMAQTYERMGRPSDAEESFQRAVALRPDFWNGYNRLGDFYFRQRRFQDAAGQFQQAIDRTPDNAYAWLNLGAAYERLRRLPEAEQAYRTSLRFGPSYQGYSNLSEVYRLRGDYAQAAQALEQALTVNDKDPRAWINLGNIYAWMKQDAKLRSAYVRALRLMEEAVKLNPQDPAARGAIASLYAALGMRDQALVALQAAQALAPGDADVLEAAIGVYECLGEREQALRWAEKYFKSGGAIDNLKDNPQLDALLNDPRFHSKGK
jgi:serine/threonine protein kinase/Tfp pilus assembly protein PilF